MKSWDMFLQAEWNDKSFNHLSMWETILVNEMKTENLYLGYSHIIYMSFCEEPTPEDMQSWK